VWNDEDRDILLRGSLPKVAPVLCEPWLTGASQQLDEEVAAFQRDCEIVALVAPS
jgi:hypothetical protein